MTDRFNERELITIITYPNQDVVCTKHLPHDKDNGNYGCLNVDAVCRAYKELNGNAFALYVRLLLNKDGFQYALGPASVGKEMGISESGYRKAKRELIRKGYLVREKDGNILTIYELPTCTPVTINPCYDDRDTPVIRRIEK